MGSEVAELVPLSETASKMYNDKTPRRFNQHDRFLPHSRKGNTNCHVDIERKEIENEKLRRAFGIRDEEHVVGAAFDQELQNKKKIEKKESLMKEEQKRL